MTRIVIGLEQRGDSPDSRRSAIPDRRLGNSWSRPNVWGALRAGRRARTNIKGQRRFQPASSKTAVNRFGLATGSNNRRRSAYLQEFD
jgi:hypothetical protein